MNKVVNPFHVTLDDAQKDLSTLIRGDKIKSEEIIDAFREFGGFLRNKDSASCLMALDGVCLMASVQVWTLTHPVYQSLNALSPSLYIALICQISSAIIAHAHNTREMSAEELDRELERMLKETEQRIKGEAGGSF